MREFATAMAAAIATSAVVLSLRRPIPHRPGRWWLGLTCIWAGAAVNRLARRELGVSYRARLTVVDGHEVTDSGPYEVVRHPMYSGASLVCVGSGLAVGSPLAMAVWALPIIALVRRIGVEEEMLREALGAAYDEYADGRARLVPGVW